MGTTRRDGSRPHQQFIRAAALAGLMASAGAAYAVDTVYTGPVGGTWDADANWSQAGADTLWGTPDDVHVQPQPGTPPTIPGDSAIILDGSTVNLTSVETPGDVQVSMPSHAADTSATHGVARLNIGTGATLTTTTNTGIRVGRALDASQALGSSRGEIVQTGGNVIIQTGANGLRLSQADTGAVADSFYQISGGSLRGGSGANGTMVSDLRVGAIANTWDEAEFHVVGSAATSIRFLDIQAAGNSAENGDSIFHFSIDSGGVTTVVAEDELQWRGDATNGLGNNFLEIDLIGEAPQTDITLFLADRLNTNGVPSGAANEHFTNILEGDLVVRDFGQYRYTWQMDYTDPASGADDGVLDASVVLRFVSREDLIPEPASLTLCGIGGLALLRRQRRAR